MWFAEQECHLTEQQVDDPHHLDKKPGYQLQNPGTSCTETSRLTELQKCTLAKLYLDPKASDVLGPDDASFAVLKGCSRQRNETYRQRAEDSSYLWYFNPNEPGQPNADSEPVCKGKAKPSCAHIIDHIRSFCILELSSFPPGVNEENIICISRSLI